MSIATHVNKDNPRDHTVVLVHGGWQTPDVFTALVKYLERAGYSVLAPALPSVGTIPAVPNFDEDVKAVRDAVKSLVDTGKKVIIVMHSYGAVPGCEALKDFVQEVGKDDYEDVDLQGGVVRLLFLAGMVLAPGMSTWSPNRTGPVPGFTEQVNIASKLHDNGYLNALCQNNLVTLHDGATRFYQDLGAEDAAYWASKLQVHSMLYASLVYLMIDVTASLL